MDNLRATHVCLAEVYRLEKELGQQSRALTGATVVRIETSESKSSVAKVEPMPDSCRHSKYELHTAPNYKHYQEYNYMYTISVHSP